MNYAQKMWRRILSVVLAVAIILTMIPITETYAAGKPNTVDIQSSESTLEITKDNSNPTATLSVSQGYDADGNDLPENTAYTYVSGTTSDSKVAEVSGDTGEIVVTAVGRGKTEIGVTLSYVADDATTVEVTGSIEIEVWETPEVTLNNVGNGAVYYSPNPTKFEATSTSGVTPKLTITKDGADVENGTVLNIGTYTITVSVPEDSNEFYRANSAEYTYTVNKETIKETNLNIPSEVYWNETISFTLPEQSIKGEYNIALENLSSEGDLPTAGGKTVQLTANGVIGNAKVTIEYTPTDDENYESLKEEHTIDVKKVPIKAEWTKDYKKTYDGETSFEIEESPQLSFDGVEGEAYELPEDLQIDGSKFEFTLNSADAGPRTAKLNVALTLSDTDTEHFKLTDSQPTVSVTVKPIELTADQIDCTPMGKNYDGTSEAVFEVAPYLVRNDSMPEDYKTLILSYEANYYDAEGNECFGDPEGNVSAESVVLSNLALSSENYIFPEGESKKLNGSYEIKKNAGFLKFTGKGSLGNTATENKNGEEIEIHWLNSADQADITAKGCQFSVDPRSEEWKSSYSVSDSTPVKIYAKADDTGYVSGGIYVALDDQSAEGQFLAEITEESAQIKIEDAFSKKYEILRGGSTIEIKFYGTDSDSKISKIEVYGSDTAWEEYNKPDAWTGKTLICVKDVNQTPNKSAKVTETVITIGKASELKQFYYARVTDFAGNVSYISSSGVLQDITAPEATISLPTADKTFENRSVYSSKDLIFEIRLTDSGISSGIASVKLSLKDYSGNEIAQYTVDTEDIWTSEDAINAIKELAKEETPTDEQIEKANKGPVTGKLTQLADGYYTLSAVLTDKVGHDSEEASVSFIVDTAEPEITIDNQLTFNTSRTDDNLYTGGFMEITIKELTLTTDLKDLLKAHEGIDGRTLEWDIKRDEKTGLATYTTKLTFGKNAVYQEGTYEFTVEAEDAVEKQNSEDFDSFVIDYTMPTYTVEFSDPDNSAYIGDTVNGKEKLYYNKAIEAEITITEATTYDDRLITICVKKADDVEVIKWENGTGTTANDNYEFEHVAGEKTFRLIINGVDANDDDGYTFEISGKDMAGNELEAADESSETAVGKVRAMDVTAPVLTDIAYIAYDTIAQFNAVGTRDYVNAETKMTFTMTEHNPRDNKASVTSKGSSNSTWSGTDDEYTTDITVPMYGEKGDEQTITLTIIDKAGNKAKLKSEDILRSKTNTAFNDGVFTDKFTVDTVAPKIEMEYLTFSPDRKNVDGIDYFKQGVTVKVTVDEHNFDEKLFEQPVKKTDSSVAYAESAWETSGDIHVKTFTFSKDNQYDLSIIGTDNAKNNFGELTTSGDLTASIDSNNSKVAVSVAVDSTLPAIGDTAKPIIVITPGKAPGETADGESLYNTDVTYEVVVYDPLLNQYASGIDNISFTVIGEDGTTSTCTVDKGGNISDGGGVSIKRVGGDVSKLAQGVENKYTFHVTVSSGTFNTNGIVLSVSAEDVSTNVTKDVEAAPIAIDTTAPKVVVSYDNNEVSNGKYFHDTRIATIRVTERNFSNDCLQFLVNGKDVGLNFQLESAGSGNRDDAVWVASYAFDVDGDYVIEVTCKDLAGNEGTIEYVGEAPQDFTIDKTIPIITVVYDNNDFKNEYYYKEARTATITIEEHNFSANDVLITMTATDDGKTLSVPPVNGWSDEGDYHRATIHYNYDADFTFDIEYMDLATNQAADYEQDHFVVDMTAPELEIFDIEHMSANNGVVRPGIRYHDTNYDKDGTVILMTGYHNGVVEMTGARKLEANGLELKLDDFAYVQEMDDIYTMHAEVYDLAGNSSEATVMFSVNRFGSVYTFDEKTDALIGDNGKYYTNKEQELVITETNVDTLEFKEITCNLNGKLTTLKEGQDYTVSLNGNEATWKQYTYTIKEDNFVEEGTYILTIYSEDRATNTSDNSSKGKKIEFVVDKTNPSVLISGVENNGQYRTNSREMTLDIEDNVRLSQVAVTIDGVETVYDSAQIQEADGKFVMNIGSANHWQEIEVTVTDAAGNEEISEEMRVLVTANIFVQYFMNKPLFYGSLGALAAIAAFLWWFLVGKKKKENEEEAK